MAEAAGARGYRAIEDYAAIGDCHGAALVASDGGIDWACFGRFDAEPLCARLLDAQRGGFVAVRPLAPHRSERAYVERTHLLRTEFTDASGGRVALTDFMPVGRRAGAGPHDYVHLEAPGWLVRRIEVLHGEVGLDVEVRLPAFDGAPVLHSDLPLDGDAARHGRVTLRAGERRYLVLAPAGATVEATRLDALQRITAAFWREWAGYCRYRGPYRAAVERSALALKLMTFAPTGAPAAALTSSLPETVGGERNWDYRFCWVRDATLGLHALSALGYSGEAQCFFDFLRKVLEPGVEHLPVMLGIGMERRLDEVERDDFEGWRGSRPVRFGNAAYLQRQTDLFGYVLEGAAVYRAMAGRFAPGDRALFERIVEFIGGCWNEPDLGLWEVRGGPRHFVHSKAMCWVVVDRAIALFGARPDWLALRQRIWDELSSRGIDPRGGHFLQTYADAGGGARTDAALLLLPLLGLPVDADTCRRTREAIERELGRGDDLLLRYTPGDDGLGGDEGAFAVCSFWRVDALLHEGLHEQARALFERLLARANDVGLYAEQIDPAGGAFLGNFPQAFTHLGLINSAVNLELVRKHGGHALRGGHAERIRRAALATFGWRGVLAAFVQTGRLGLWSSRRSQMPRSG